jgi:hypothetical protein
MAHITIAASEAVFAETLKVVVNNFVFEKADSGDFGAFNAGYDVKLLLEGGSIDLRDDGTIRLRELDGRWEKLEFTLGVDIEELCVGGGCLDLPFPLPDICLPEWCVFSADPDVQITLDLAPFVRQELSLVASPLVEYFDPATTTIDPLCQKLHTALGIDDTKTEWRIFCDPGTIDFDPFDFADTVGGLFEDALTAVIETLIPAGIVRDLVLAIIGSVADLIRAVLDIPDDFKDWLSDLFNISFGLGNLILQVIADFFGKCVSFFQIEDPYPVLSETSTLIPVRIPIRNLTAAVNDVEMVVTADIGA